MNAYGVRLKTDIKLHKILAILCATIIIFSLFNIFLGVKRGLSIDPDFWVNYTGGVIWNEKGDNYSVRDFTIRFVQIAGIDIASSRAGANRYPPQGLMFFGLLAHFSVQTAAHIELAINFILLIVSTWLFGRIISWYRPIGLLETTFLLALAGSMYGRVNLGNSQFGIIICTFVLGSFLLMRRREKVTTILGGILLALTSFKPTFLPVYLLYYLWRRAYWFLAACIVTGILLTFVPLILNQMPVVSTIEKWVGYVRNQDDGDNNPSPFNSYSVGMTHLEPLVFRVLNNFSTTNRLISNIVIAVISLYSGFLIVRTKNPTSSELIDFAIVSGVTLFAIYHRLHDLFLIFPGLICIYLRIFDSKRRSEQVLLSAMLVAALFVFTLPGDFMANLTIQNPALSDSYLWRVIAPIQTWASIAVFATIIQFKRRELATQGLKIEPILSTTAAT